MRQGASGHASRRTVGGDPRPGTNEGASFGSNLWSSTMHQCTHVQTTVFSGTRLYGIHTIRLRVESLVLADEKGRKDNESRRAANQHGKKGKSGSNINGQARPLAAWHTAGRRLRVDKGDQCKGKTGVWKWKFVYSYRTTTNFV